MPSFLDSLSEAQSTSASILQSMSETFSNPSSEGHFETFSEAFPSSSDFQMSTNTYSNEESNTIKDQTSTAIAEVVSSTVYSTQSVAIFSERYQNNRSKFKEDVKFICDPCPRKSALSATSSQHDTETSKFHSVSQQSTQEEEHVSISSSNEIYTEASNSQSKFGDFTAEAATESEKRKFSSVTYTEETNPQQEDTTVLTTNEASGITDTEQEISQLSNTITELISSNNNQEISSEEESVSYDSTEQTNELLPTANEGGTLLENESESSISTTENEGLVSTFQSSTTNFETSTGIFSNHDQEVNPERNSTVINESVSKDNHASETGTSESDESNLSSMSKEHQGTILPKEENATFMNNEENESTESVFTNRENSRSSSDHNPKTTSSMIQAISESTNIMTESIFTSVKQQSASINPEQDTTLEEEIKSTGETSLENENIFSSAETGSNTFISMNGDQEATFSNANTEFPEDIETNESSSRHYGQSFTSEGEHIYSENRNTLLNESASRATAKEFGKSIQTESVTSSAVEMPTVLRSLTAGERNKPNYEVPTLEYVTKSTERNVAAKKEQDRKHKMSQEEYKIDYQKYICDPCPRANRYLKKFRYHTVKDEYFPTLFESSTHTQLTQGPLAKMSDTFTQQPMIIRNKFTDYQQGITMEVPHNPAEDIDNRLETQIATELAESDTSSTFKELKNMLEQASTLAREVSLVSEEQSESELNAFSETLKLRSTTSIETNESDVYSELPSQESNEQSMGNKSSEADQGTAILSPLEPLFRSGELPTRMFQITTKEADESRASHISDLIPPEADQGTAIMSPLEPLFRSGELPTRMLQITTKETEESSASHISDHIPLFGYSQASLIPESEEMYSNAMKKTSQQLSDNSKETNSNTEILTDLERTREVENEDQRLHKSESHFGVTANHAFGMHHTKSIGETDFTLKHNKAEKNLANKQNQISATAYSATKSLSEITSLAYGRSFQTEFNEEQVDTVSDAGLITDVKSTYGHNFATGTLGKEEIGQIVEGVNLSLTIQMPVESDILSTSSTRKSVYQKGASLPSIKSEDEFSISSEVPVHYVYIFAENCTQPQTTSFQKEDTFVHTRDFTSTSVPEPHNFGAATGVSLQITSSKTEQFKAPENEENAATYEITSENPTEHTKASETASEKITMTETALLPSEESESVTTEIISNTMSAEELEEEFSKQHFNFKGSTSQEMGNESAPGSLNEPKYRTSEFITSKSKTQNIALSTSKIKTDHLLRSTTELVTTPNIHRKHTKNNEEFVTVASTAEIDNNLVGMETTPCKYCIEKVSNPHSKPIQYYFSSTPTAPQVTALNTETQYETLAQKTEEAATSKQITEEEDNKTDKEISSGEFYEYSKNAVHTASSEHQNELTAENFSQTKIDEVTIQSEPQLVEETLIVSNTETSTSEDEKTISSLYNNEYRTYPPMDDNKYESSKRKESSNSYFSKPNTESASSTESEATKQEVNEYDSEEHPSAKETQQFLTGNVAESTKTFDSITTESARGETGAVPAEEETFSKYTSEETNTGSSILISYPSKGLTNETATESEENIETTSKGKGSKSTIIAPQSAQMSTAERSDKPASEINAESEKMNTNSLNAQEESETEIMANSEEESITRLQTDQIFTVLRSSPVSTLAESRMYGKSSPLTMAGEHDKNTTENAEETVQATSADVEKSEAHSQSEISDSTSLTNDEETSVATESNEGLVSNDATTELNTESSSLTEGSGKQEPNSETQGFTHTTSVPEGSEATEVSALGEVASEGENTGSLEGTTSEADNATKLTSNQNENMTNTEASGEGENVGPESTTLQEFTQHLSSETATGSTLEGISKNSLESSETTEEKHEESSLDESRSEESSSTEIKELTTNEVGQGASSAVLEGSTGSEVSSTENISDYSELNTTESTENANVSGANSQGTEQIESSTTEITGNMSSPEVSNETGLNENSASESNTGTDNEELASSENISGKSEETQHVESSQITEQTEPEENETSEHNENLSSSEHSANQTEPSEMGTTEGTENVASSAHVSDEAEYSESSSPEGTENETIFEGEEKLSSTEHFTEIGSNKSVHLSSSIITETESVESDTSEGMENRSSTGSGLNETEREESFNSGASGMSSEVSEGTTSLEELESESPLNNSIESEVTGEGKEHTSEVHNEEHSTLSVEEEEGTQSSFEESITYTKGTMEISTGPSSEQETQSLKFSEITEKISAENTGSINAPEQTGPEASSTEETHGIHSENAVNTAEELITLTHMLVQTTTEVESFHFEFGSSTECEYCHTANSETTRHSQNELERATSPEENGSKHVSSHGYSGLTTEMNIVSSTHHHLKQSKKSEETLLTTIEVESGLVAMETTPCEYCSQSASDHHSTASAVETKPHSISLSTETHEQSEKEELEQQSQTENEIEETSRLEHHFHSKTTLHHPTSKLTSATPEMHTEEEENEEVTKLHSHSTMEKIETEKESTHVSKTTKYPTFSTTEETEETEEQTTISLVHTTEEPTTKQAAIRQKTTQTENEIENYTEKIQESGQSSTEKVSHKPVVYVINNSKGKYKKINEFMIEQIISTRVPNVELHLIDLNDEEVLKPLENLQNRSWDIDIPHQVCSKADFDSENNCFCNINTYLDTLENRISKKEDIKAKYSYCKSFLKLTKGLIIENSIEPIKRKRRGLIYLDDKKKKSDTLNFDSIEGMLDQSFNLPISGVNMFYLPTETVNILCSNSSAEHQKQVSWTWSFYPISSPKAQLLPESGPELVIHEGLLKHSGNYTCKHEKNHHLPAAEHWHQLEMLTFPIYQIILNIYYKINDSCGLQIGDTLYAYLPKIISPLLCTKDGEVCSLDIDRPRCLTREDDNYFNVTINVKTISDFVLRFSSTCDINCKLSVYENMVNMVYKNSEMIIKLPVLSKLDQLHQIDFIPHLNGKVGSPVTIKAPKVTVYCAAGFGLESEKQRVCVVCPPQTFSPDNAAFCTSCPGGQYQPEAGSKTCIQCNSPVDDKLCLRMLYTNTKLFKIYVGVAFAVIVLMIIIIIVWTSGFKDESHGEDGYKGSLRHRAASNRKDVDLETGVNAPLLGRSPNRTAPRLPPLDF